MSTCFKMEEKYKFCLFFEYIRRGAKHIFTKAKENLNTRSENYNPKVCAKIEKRGCQA